MNSTVGPEDGRIATTPENKRIGRSLRVCRARLGWSQAEMAAYLTESLGLPISRQSVSAWESGRRTVPAAVLTLCLRAAEGSPDSNPLTMGYS